jgi:hypothetical protein
MCRRLQEVQDLRCRATEFYALFRHNDRPLHQLGMSQHGVDDLPVRLFLVIQIERQVQMFLCPQQLAWRHVHREQKGQHLLVAWWCCHIVDNSGFDSCLANECENRTGRTASTIMINDDGHACAFGVDGRFGEKEPGGWSAPSMKMNAAS